MQTQTNTHSLGVDWIKQAMGELVASVAVYLRPDPSQNHFDIVFSIAIILNLFSTLVVCAFLKNKKCK